MNPTNGRKGIQVKRVYRISDFTVGLSLHPTWKIHSMVLLQMCEVDSFAEVFFSTSKMGVVYNVQITVGVRMRSIGF